MALPFNLVEMTMGLLDEVGKIAGAVAAVEAAEKVDPDAGLLTKAVAAVAASRAQARWKRCWKRRKTRPRPKARKHRKMGLRRRLDCLQAQKDLGDPAGWRGFCFLVPCVRGESLPPYGHI